MDNNKVDYNKLKKRMSRYYLVMAIIATIIGQAIVFLGNKYLGLLDLKSLLIGEILILVLIGLLISTIIGAIYEILNIEFDINKKIQNKISNGD